MLKLIDKTYEAFLWTALAAAATALTFVAWLVEEKENRS